MSRFCPHLDGKPVAVHQPTQTGRGTPSPPGQQHGILPISARNLNTAIIQEAMLYASEVAWRGKTPSEWKRTSSWSSKTWPGQRQAHSNRPPEALPWQKVSWCRQTLLDYRQAESMRRLMAWPEGHYGLEEILERRGSELTERLQYITILKLDERLEEIRW